MKKCVSLVLCLMMVLGVVVAQASTLDNILAAGKITVATSPDYPPLEFIDPTKTGMEAIVGADMVLAAYIAEKLGVALDIQAMDFSAVIGSVTQNKVNLAMSGLSITEERKEAVDFTESYIMDDLQTLLVMADKVGDYTAAEAFAGKKVAVQNGTLQQTLLTSQLPDAKMELVTNLSDAVLMLVSGKVDAVAVSGENGAAFAKNYPTIALCTFTFENISEGYAIAIAKGQPELMAALNEIILEIKAQGMFEQWMVEATLLCESLGIDME